MEAMERTHKMTAYLNILNELYSINKFAGVHLGLGRVMTLLDLLGNPQNKMKTIHIAGTNGKGSVCIKLASSLQGNNQKIGLFSSPHLFSFRERISINGINISKDDVVLNLSKVIFLSKKKGLEATFFEILVAAAFLYFESNEVDIAIFETGIGGRYDATNVMIPILSIITSIGLDHTEILGDTLEKIALDKAGIIKPKIPVLLGSTAQNYGIEEIALKMGAPLFCSEKENKDYFIDNLNTADLALDILKSLYPEIEVNRKGLIENHKCRFEKFVYRNKLSDVEVVFDVAHNEKGLEKTLHKCKVEYPNHRIVALISLGEKEGLQNIKNIFLDQVDHIILLDIKHYRLLPLEKLETLFEGDSKVSVQKGELKKYLNETLLPKEGEISTIYLFCGSFYIMKDVHEALNIDIECDPVNLQEWLNVEVKVN